MALISRFPLTTNGNDVVGTNIATNQGGVTFSSSGARFYSMYSTALTYSFSSPPSGAMSMSIWIRPLSLNGEIGIFNFTGNTISYSESRGLYTSGSSLHYFPLTSPATSEFTSSNYPSNSYTLMVVTIKANGAVNGYRGNTLVKSSSAPITAPVTTLKIGMCGTGMYFDGYMKDARIYNHELSSSEIADLVSAGPDTPIIVSSLIPPQCWMGGM